MRKAHTGVPSLWRRREVRVINGEAFYRCGTCKAFKPRDAFYAEKRTLFGIKSQCKTCHSRTAISSRDPEKVRASGRRSEAARRARKANRSVAITLQDWIVLEHLWGTKCLKCGSTHNLQWDHIVPLSRGGDHCVENLQRLCKKCNEHKHAKGVDYRSQRQKQWIVEFKRSEGARP
jgi:5-methylcytosine-specific restriction endonuclease McrA